MSLNSVNTNQGAMIALQSLNNTNSQLAITQKQISTGYRVASASDDGAAYSIAQGIRSTVGALTSANQQLGNAQGLLQTTNSALTDISKTMASMRNVLVKLGGGNMQASDVANYDTQYKSLLANLKTFVQDASYNGKTLIGDIATGPNAATPLANINIARNESGGTYGLSTFSGSALYGSLAQFGSSANTTTQIAAALTATGLFVNHQNAVGQALNTVGSSINYVSNQVTYNNNKIDALNSGLGSLVDADLAKESAQLTALQIRQQLGTQALSMANSAPQSLMSLFR